ncbi:granzyme A [Pelobates cultripes]|uniref:Granzyme A n=2 Tax=Pelobates cultripes TaxID=61616 RepID=A0AAD1SAQ5_PELCU|nr:granzyme A [Pelobates cultripes]
MGFLSICYTSALFLLVVFSKGDSVEIIGGKKANPHSRPYMAFLIGKKYCGGTLIKTNWVLTAAHCQFDSKSVVILGAQYWKENESEQQRFSVSKTVPHPDYQSCTRSNDIQLIQLKGNAKLNKFVSVFQLPKSTEDVKISTVCDTAGWGVTKANTKVPSDYLRETNLTIVDRNQCHKIYSKLKPKEIITDDMLCTKPLKKQKDDTCTGDSGGPLICNNELRGIVSFGSKKCSPKIPGVYTRLTSQYVKWIQTTIGGDF